MRSDGASSGETDSRPRVLRAWADAPLRTKAIGVVALPILALFVSGSAFFAATREAERADDQVRHTVEVQATIQQVLTLLLNAETGVRGYLLTDDPAFLEPHLVARERLPAEVARLVALSAHDPAQHARAETIAATAAIRLDVLESLRQADPAAPTTQQTMLEGKRLMDQLRVDLDAMRAHEARLLDARTATADRWRTIGELVGASSAAIGLIGGLAAIWLLMRGIVRRVEAVAMNTERLRAGQPLLPAGAGNDEIGRLAAGLEEAAALLAARERELVDARRFLEYVIESSPGVILRSSLPERVPTYISPNVARIVGYRPEEVLGVPQFWVQHVHPDDLPRVASIISAVLEDRIPEGTVEYRFRDAQGNWRWFSSVVRPERDADGHMVGLLGYGVDVTERVEAEARSRAADRRYRLLAAHFPDGSVGLFDHDLRFTIIDGAGLARVGQSRELLEGKTIFETLPPDLIAQIEPLYRSALAGQPAEADVAFFGNVYSVRTLPVEDDTGQIIGGMVVTQDITERRRAAEAVEQARHAAEQATQAKTEFLSRMSHELRTPLNAILGFSQLLAMDTTTPEQRESLRYIEKAGHHLLALINEVLDIARIESGRLSLSVEPVRAPEVISEALDLIAPLAAQHDIRLDPPPAACDRFVLADRQRLKQVLLNLLSNAVKYNIPGGSVGISCEPAGDGRFAIRVRDTGYGIPLELADRVFTPFERLGAEQRGVEGTGLGLALCKALIEAMRGRITLESVPGAGTTVSIELPLAEAPAEQATTAEAPPPNPARRPAGEQRQLLYIEDNLSNLRLIERALTHRPHITLLTAIQGRLGLDLARQHQPDLVLLDLNLPDMSGREVLLALRNDPRTAHIPVIVVSADATARQIERLTADGAFAYLTKPLDILEFLATIDRAITIDDKDA